MKTNNNKKIQKLPNQFRDNLRYPETDIQDKMMVIIDILLRSILVGMAAQSKGWSNCLFFKEKNHDSEDNFN